MNTQTDARWARLAELFDAAVALGAAERGALLAGIDDAPLRSELERLLAADAQVGVLDRPLVEVASAVQADGDALVGRDIGHWRVVEILGRGGMGAVYRAARADGAYTQDAALKLIGIGVDSQAARERFRRERQILASLRHPNIAMLLDGGVSVDGTPYLAMELVEGERIDTYCDARRLSVGERLRLMLQVLAAVQHAHQRLIVHRDLKPSNILVTADGLVKLLDFGIATALDVSGAATATRDRPLTPDYAAPEQLEGQPVTTATDVYALGLVLAELLAGPRAKAGARTQPVSLAAFATHADATSIAAARAVQPRQLARLLRGDLDTVVQRALAPEAARRYPSAAALATDIEQWLAGRPILARPDSWLYRTRTFVRRNRVGVALSALAIVALLAATVFSVQQARIARDAARDAEARALSLRAVNDTFDQLMHGEHFLPDANGPASAARLLRENLSALNYFLVDQPLTRASLLWRNGRGLRLAGDPAAAVAVLRTAADAFAKAGASATLDGHAAALELARAQFGSGDPQAAAQTLAQLEQALRPDEVNIELQRHAIAFLRAQTAFAAGELEEAQRQVAAALALAPAPSGERGARYGTTALLAGAIASARNDTAAATDRFVEALQAMTADPHAELAPPHQDLAAAIWTLGQLGDSDAAKDYSARWLDLRMRFFGAESAQARAAAALQDRLRNTGRQAIGDTDGAARLRDAFAAYWHATFVNYDVTRDQKPLNLDRDL